MNEDQAPPLVINDKKMPIRARLGARYFVGAAACALVACLIAMVCGITLGQTDRATAPYGIPTRIPWASSHVHGSPEPPPPYKLERAYPHLAFTNPLEIAFAPGGSRVFVAEQGAKIYSFPNDENCRKPDLLVDLHVAVQDLDKVPFSAGVSSIYGFALHPQFQQQRYVYVCYILDIKPPAGHAPLTPKDQQGTRVSRFTVSDTDPPRVVPGSEKILLTWFAGGHNAGCVKFGPEGNLYVSTGDGGDPDPPDPFNTGQDISDLLCSVLRIDVDHPDDDKPYSIPKDNPFIHTAGARPEVYAYGLRNPWKFSFDRATGNLWCGDVGWELWESVDCVKPGGNYGWSIMEGPNPVHPDGKRGPTPITPPAVALPHTEAASLTGGVVYRGKKLPELIGHYLFGDWQTNLLWDAKVNGDTLEPHRTIAKTDQRIVAFGEDADGEPIIVDHQGGGLWRIVHNDSGLDPAQFPRKLSQTGLFTDTAKQLPAPGVTPFSINAPQWLDGATARRWVAVPGTGNVDWGKGVWGDDKPMWPTDSVLVRTLSIESLPGRDSTARPIETQLLHFDGRHWNAYTYAWNAGHTDAELIGADGDQRSITVPDMQDMTLNMPKHNGVKQQPWRFESRAQCMTCHNVWNDYAMAFTGPQLDRTADFGGTSDNEARTFRHLGLLLDPKKSADDPGTEKPTLTDPYDTSANLNERARSYLSVNCSVCHRFGGGGSALFDVRKELPPNKLNVIDAHPNLGTFGLDDARIVCPGDPARSVLLYRMAKLGRGRMPHIGSEQVDHRGLQLMIDWIRSLNPDKAADPTAAAMKLSDPAALDQLLASPTGALSIICALHSSKFDSADAYNLMTSKGLASKNETVHDLFRAYDPNELAHPHLGPNVNPVRLLAMKGDAARGRQIFFGAGNAAAGLCARCHKIDNQGTDFGPDLSHIATKYNRADLLDNVLNPSKTIAPGYATTLVRTKSGDTYSGILVSKSEMGIVLKGPDLKLTHVPATDVDRIAVQTISSMPEGLLADLESAAAADLLEYLASLK